MKDTIYLIFRNYSEEERPDSSPRDRVIFYGWTTSKDVLNAFFTQRSKKKYKVIKSNQEEMDNIYGEYELSAMIDMVPLKFASTGEEINFFTTTEELKEIEIRIQRYFKELPDLVNRCNGKTTLLSLYVNLDDYYLKALEYLGFKPIELDDLSGDLDTLEDIEDVIDDAYTSSDYPSENIVWDNKMYGLDFFEHVHNKILYSVESFIKVLKEDL